VGFLFRFLTGVFSAELELQSFRHIFSRSLRIGWGLRGRNGGIAFHYAFRSGLEDVALSVRHSEEAIVDDLFLLQYEAFA